MGDRNELPAPGQGAGQTRHVQKLLYPYTRFYAVSFVLEHLLRQYEAAAEDGTLDNFRPQSRKEAYGQMRALLRTYGDCTPSENAQLANLLVEMVGYTVAGDRS